MNTDTLEFSPVEITAPLETPTPTPAMVPPAPTEQKKGRGRPRKDSGAPSGNQVKKPVETPTGSTMEEIRKKVEENRNRLNEKEQGLNPIVNPGEVQSASVVTASLIDGYMLISLMDVFCPAVLKLLFKKKFEGLDIDKMMLTDIQKKSLEPLADEFARHVSQYINPIYAFLGVSSMLYYQNATKELGKQTKK